MYIKDRIALIILLLSTALLMNVAQSKAGDVSEPFIKAVTDLNEFTERRRVNTFFTNEQSIFYGLPKGFVNVGRGNLTFVRRDLVTVGRLPIMFARVYDSSRQDRGDFGIGWYSNYDETISFLQNGNLLFVDESRYKTLFVANESGYVIAKGEVSDVIDLNELSSETIQIKYRSGLSKYFQKLGEKYHLSLIQDKYGNKVQLYYVNEKLNYISGQNGHFLNLIRDNDGRVIQVTDDEHRSIYYQYDSIGRLAEALDLRGGKWKYQYQKNQPLITEIFDPDNNTAASFSYNESKKVVKSNIRSFQYSYQYTGNKTEVIDEAKNSTLFTQNEQGITTSVINAEGYSSRIKLNQYNQVEQLFHDEQLTTKFTYDSFGKISQVSQLIDNGTYVIRDYAPNTQSCSNISSEELNGLLNNSCRVTTRTINEAQHTYTYGEYGDVIKEVFGTNELVYVYNDDGLLTELMNNGNKAKFTYNTLGKFTSITFPDGNMHEYQYNKLGMRISTKRSDGVEIYYSYDRIGNLRGITTNNEKGLLWQQDIVVDQKNKVESVFVNGKPAMEIKYDDLNLQSIQSSGIVTKYSYDKTHRLTSVTNGKGNVEKYHYQQGEKDLRVQLDNRTGRVHLPEHKISHNMTRLYNALYTRNSGLPWQHIAWDETLGRLSLTESLITQSNSHNSSVKYRRLYDATSTNKLQQINFDKPSNSYFLPPEYEAINCEPGGNCDVYSVSISGPSSVEQGESADFTANAWTANCLPTYDFSVDGTRIGSSGSGVFSHTFSTTGNHTIKIEAECECGFVGYAYMTKAVLVNKATCSASGRTLDEIESDYRSMITLAGNFGWQVAAGNMNHFLSSSGSELTLLWTWLESFSAFQSAIDVNIGRFEQSISDIADRLNNGQSERLIDNWDRLVQGNTLTELYYASGNSTLSSSGDFIITKSLTGNVTVTGTINHSWYDPYDWHAGLTAYIPGFGLVSDSEALCLVNAGRAEEFNMRSSKQQNYVSSLQTIKEKVKNEYEIH